MALGILPYGFWISLVVLLGVLGYAWANRREPWGVSGHGGLRDRVSSGITATRFTTTTRTTRPAFPWTPRMPPGGRSADS